MMQGLAQTLAHCELAPGVAGRLLHHALEARAFDVVGAGKRYQYAARAQQLEGTQVDFFVATQGFGEGSATVGEGGRIEYDQVKQLTASLELAEAVKDIAGFKPATLAETIARGILLRHLQYRGRAVHPQYFFSPSGSGMYTASTSVTKSIQHTASRWYQTMQRQMVVRLIEVKARFVTTCEIHLKG